MTTGTHDDMAMRTALVDTLSTIPGVVAAAATPDSVELEFERTTVTAQELVDVIAAQMAPSGSAADTSATAVESQLRIGALAEPGSDQ